MFEHLTDTKLRHLVLDEIESARALGMNTTPALDRLVEEQGRRAECAAAERERGEVSGVYRLPQGWV